MYPAIIFGLALLTSIECVFQNLRLLTKNYDEDTPTISLVWDIIASVLWAWLFYLLH